MIKRKFLITGLLYLLACVFFGIYIYNKMAGYHYLTFRVIAMIFLVTAFGHLFYTIYLLASKKDKENEEYNRLENIKED